MPALSEVIGESPAIRAVKEQCARLVALRGETRRLPSVLLQGETGTGKGLMARALHAASPRRDAPFVDVNCAAIPETLLEAEMFGFERGAFTDARQAKPGLFQTAHRGTIFLDEVGLLPEALQAKLLKVIEERTVRRLGATRSEPVDVWILTGTNEDMAAAVRERRFREDLYHRLAVLTITLPPVRARGDDVVRLAEHFLARACSDYGFAQKTLSADARASLLAYRWPGNVRELGNVIERAALLGEGSELTAASLGLSTASVAEDATAPEPLTLDAAVSAVEREQLLDALRVTGGNVSRAAGRLGISRNTMRYRMEKYGLGREGPAASIQKPRAQRAAPVRAERAGTPVAPPAAAPLAVPDEVPTPAGIRWERRRLTFVRAELSGVSLDRPQSSRELETVVEKVQTFGGRIEELGLTGVFAVFGVEPSEDAPRRAVLAAMAMRNAIARDAVARLRVAVHVEQCLVARVQRNASVDLDAKREATQILAGLLAVAGDAPITVSDAAAPFLERRFELVPLGEPGSGRRLVGRERVGLAPAGRMGPFIGRERELDLLRNHLKLAAGGAGQVVGIVGEPGIGKSRLLFELRHALPSGVAYLEGRCLSHGAAIPYLPIVDLVRASCGIGETDEPETVVARVGAALGAEQLDAAERARYLLHLLGIKDGADGVDDMDPDVVRSRLFETLRQLWVQRSRREPLVIVAEDLHWVDGASEACLASVVDTIPRAAILLVAVHRPGYRPPWINRSYVAQIALPPLAQPDSRTLVRAAIGDAGVPDPVLDVILAKAEGNPFFLEELTRVVRDDPDAALAVPDTVEAVLLARIDRLTPEEKRVLQCAAVIGRRVPVALLRDLVARPGESLRRTLASLQAAEFLYASGVGSDEEYAFKHALTQDVAYASLFVDERQTLHASVVELIEARAGDRLDDHIDALAHHAFESGVADKAARYFRQAGLRAAARSAHREAVVCFEKAREAGRRLPQDTATVQESIDLLVDLRMSLVPLGELDRIHDCLLEAEALALQLDDQRRLGRLSAYMANYYFMTGDQGRALESGQRALAIATRLDDFALEVESQYRLGQVHYALGDYARGIEILEQCVTSLTGDFVYERFNLPGLPSVISRTWLVQCLSEHGEFAAGLAAGEEAVRIAETVNHPFSLAFAYWGVGHLLLRQGDVARATAVLERGFGVCERWEISVWLSRFASTLGYAYAADGRVAEALPLLERAVEDATSRGMAVYRALFAVSLSEGYLRAGRLTDADQLARRALDLARTHRQRGNEAWALRLLGEIAAQDDGGDLGDAERYLGGAIGLAAELGMRPLEAHCRRALGALARRRGDPAAARDELERAIARFRAMGMVRWLRPAEAERAALG
ncbi:MAG: sigma 54-interacting transcriptional regulator [Candidatus Rokubacteria bacterium]|nr:sigma 54-interacting transcriptional regulator [Candidatus Rokubacteria bacterium]